MRVVAGALALLLAAGCAGAKPTPTQVATTTLAGQDPDFTLPVPPPIVDLPPATVKPGEQLYHNETLGVAFAYPEDWEPREVQGQDGGGTAYFMAPSKPGDLPGKSRATLGMTVRPLSATGISTADGFVEAHIQMLTHKFPKLVIVSSKPVTVQGMPAREVVMTKPDLDPEGKSHTLKILSLFLVKNERGYLLYYNHDAARFKDQLGARQRALDTLSLGSS